MCVCCHLGWKREKMLLQRRPSVPCTGYRRNSEEEQAFSDVSSIEDNDATTRMASNVSRWGGRAKLAEKQRQREEAMKLHLEEAARREREQEERALAALAARANSKEDSDDGSAFSDVDDDQKSKSDSVQKFVLEQEGPDTDKVSEASDEEVQQQIAQKPPRTASLDSFGSNSSQSEGEQDLMTPQVFTRNDDANRIRITIQTSIDKPPCSLVVRLRSDWAPLGAARFLELVENKFFENVRFHRVVKGQLAQFGLPVDPSLYQKWGPLVIEDDPVIRSNSRGTLSFASRGPGTRNCQVFMNLCHNKSFDSQGFAPFAEIVQGMEVVDQIYDGYGEIPPKGSGPNPDCIKESGLAYLEGWPKLSIIQSMDVVSRSGGLDIRPSLKTPSFEEPRDPSPRKNSKKVSFSEAPCTVSSATASQSLPERSLSPAGSGLAAARNLKV